MSANIFCLRSACSGDKSGRGHPTRVEAPRLRRGWRIASRTLRARERSIAARLPAMTMIRTAGRFRRMDDMHHEIPKRIRDRAVKLLEMIALVEMGIEDEEASAVWNPILFRRRGWKARCAVESRASSTRERFDVVRTFYKMYRIHDGHSRLVDRSMCDGVKPR